VWGFDISAYFNASPAILITAPNVPVYYRNATHCMTDLPNHKFKSHFFVYCVSRGPGALNDIPGIEILVFRLSRGVSEGLRSVTFTTFASPHGKQRINVAMIRRKLLCVCADMWLCHATILSRPVGAVASIFFPLNSQMLFNLLRGSFCDLCWFFLGLL
jgi:hypothetical protein